MTKLERLREDLAKAETTLANARKRKTMLQDRIRKEEQRELQLLIDTSGLSLEDVKGLLGGATSAPVPNDTHGGEVE